MPTRRHSLIDVHRIAFTQPEIRETTGILPRLSRQLHDTLSQRYGEDERPRRREPRILVAVLAQAAQTDGRCSTFRTLRDLRSLTIPNV